MDTSTPFPPTPQDEASCESVLLPALSADAADFLDAESFLSHADALRQLIFQAELREHNRVRALERIVEWGLAYQQALDFSDEEITRVSAWARHRHDEVLFRAQNYEVFYRFTVPAGLLGPHAIPFGLIFFTITLAGNRPRLVMAPLCLNPDLADGFHHGTGAKADVVFYARDDVHEAVLMTLGGKLA